MTADAAMLNTTNTAACQHQFGKLRRRRLGSFAVKKLVRNDLDDTMIVQELCDSILRINRNGHVSLVCSVQAAEKRNGDHCKDKEEAPYGRFERQGGWEANFLCERRPRRDNVEGERGKKNLKLEFLPLLMQ